jgi:hypothetical protein
MSPYADDWTKKDVPWFQYDCPADGCTYSFRAIVEIGDLSKNSAMNHWLDNHWRVTLHLPRTTKRKRRKPSPPPIGIE